MSGIKRLLLARGESIIASIGIAIAAILLACSGASAWWMVRSQQAALARAQAEQVRAAAALVTGAAESMLAGDELSNTRSLLAEAGQRYHLSTCRIVLPDGAVIADQTASQITLNKPPEHWDGNVPTGVVDEVKDSTITLAAPLVVRGRGNARLEIAASIAPASDALAQTTAGLGGIGAIAMLGVLLVYRRVRARLRALGAIRDALLASQAGETSIDALSVAPALGPEASIWNGLLGELDAARKQTTEGRVVEALSTNRRASGGGTGGLDSACDVLAQGLVIVDEQLKARYVNGAAAVFLAGKREDLVGADITPCLTDARVVEALRATVSGASRRPTIVEAGRAGDAGVLRFAIRPVRKGEGSGAVLLIEDVTQARVSEQTRDAFLAAATHELRTPLTNIRLYVEGALDGGDADPALRAKALNVINQEARRLERIVTDMLSVAEIEAGAMQVHKDDVRLDAVFEELEADYRAQATDRKIKLDFKLPPKLPVIQGDRDKLGLALHNLLSNALKYTPEGGSVTVDVDASQTELKVAVNDSGIGISEADRARLFEKFYRAKDPRVGKIKGTGLGLALAREVVRLHGGDIAVASEKDKGSTFTITLPMAQAA